MTPQQLVGLGIRLLSLWFLYHGGIWVLQWITLPNEPGMAAFRDRFISGAVAGVSYFVASIFLWNAPMWVAHKLVPRTGHENVLNVSLFDTARVGCALIGLWIFASTLQNIVWFLISALIASGSDSVFMAMSRENRVSFAVDVFQVALALFLVLRAHGFARLIAK